MFAAAWGVINFNYVTMFIGQSLNLAGAWLRYLAVQNHSFAAAVISTVFAGASASVVVCSYGVIAERWFRPSQRALATTIAVQSNYAGWALGSLIGLILKGDQERYRQFALLQAFFVSICFPLFLLGYRAAPPHGVQDGETPKAVLGVQQSALLLCHNKQYCLYGVCYAVIGGIGFSIPSAQDVVFGTSCYSTGYNTQHTTFTNLSFIVIGVLAGLSMGALIKEPRDHEKVLASAQRVLLVSRA